jgi:hypothetical protein
MTSLSLVFQETDGGQGDRSATAPPGDLSFYWGPPQLGQLGQQMRVEDESDVETRMIENNPEFHERLVRRIRSAGETVPAEDALQGLGSDGPR